MSQPTKVLFTSCETGPGAWRHQEKMLRAAFPQGDPDLVLTEDSQAADFIFLGNLRSENDWEKVRNNPVMREFPEKTYLIDDADDVVRFWQGIFTSLTQSPKNRGRFRSGSYHLYHSDFKNPHIERWYAERALRNARPSKEYLASFCGRNCLPLRGRLLNQTWRRPDIFIQDTSKTFNAFVHESAGKSTAQEAYFNVAIRSKFMLCPRGNGATSIRFFETMQLGIAPVLISDDWVLPEGPDWNKCILRIPEDQLHTLEETLVRHEEQAEAMGAEAQRAYENYFHGEAYVRYLINAARSIRRTHTPIPERWFHLTSATSLLVEKIRRRWRRMRGR